MKDEGNVVSVAGKISAWSYGRIMRILKRKGLNIYQMIQNFCDTIIRYMDDKHNRTPDVEKAMQAGFSTAPENVRNLGFGAGMGLPNMKKYTDELSIETELGVGTTVTMKINL